MATDNKEKTSLDDDATKRSVDGSASLLDDSTSQDDTVNYQSADEDNTSKYFSMIGGDSTLEGSVNTTLGNKSDLDTSSLLQNDERPQAFGGLSNLSVESSNKLQMHEKIDAANILSGGVDIFDDNENSVDEHELVIDDDALPSEKSNDCAENGGEGSVDAPFGYPEHSLNTETNFNKHFELFKKVSDDGTPETSKQSEGQEEVPVSCKDIPEDVPEGDLKVDNYSALLQTNLPEGSSEVTLLIDDKNVEAIDIGEGVFIYKNDDGELTAIQITMNEDGSNNFKCLHVGKNEDGNLEVYEEQVNQVPVTNEELESMKAKELSKEIDTAVPPKPEGEKQDVCKDKLEQIPHSELPDLEKTDSTVMCNEITTNNIVPNESPSIESVLAVPVSIESVSKETNATQSENCSKLDSVMDSVKLNQSVSDTLDTASFKTLHSVDGNVLTSNVELMAKKDGKSSEVPCVREEKVEDEKSETFIPDKEDYSSIIVPEKYQVNSKKHIKETKNKDESSVFEISALVDTSIPVLKTSNEPNTKTSTISNEIIVSDLDKNMAEDVKMVSESEVVEIQSSSDFEIESSVPKTDVCNMKEISSKNAKDTSGLQGDSEKYNVLIAPSESPIICVGSQNPEILSEPDVVTSPESDLILVESCSSEVVSAVNTKSTLSSNEKNTDFNETSETVIAIDSDESKDNDTFCTKIIENPKVDEIPKIIEECNVISAVKINYMPSTADMQQFDKNVDIGFKSEVENNDSVSKDLNISTSEDSHKNVDSALINPKLLCGNSSDSMNQQRDVPTGEVTTISNDQETSIITTGIEKYCVKTSNNLESTIQDTPEKKSTCEQLPQNEIQLRTENITIKSSDREFDILNSEVENTQLKLNHIVENNTESADIKSGSKKVISEDKNPTEQGTEINKQTKLENCYLERSPLKLLGSQSSLESEDDLEEDDYVDGEPVTGDSEVEWISTNNIDSNAPKSGFTAEVSNHHSKSSSISEANEILTTGPKELAQINSLNQDDIVNKSIDMLDNNNEISIVGVSDMKKNDDLVTKNNLTEIDFDKFVRRNSVPLFEECTSTDFEDISKTIKKLSVPVVEQKHDVQVGKFPGSTLPSAISKKSDSVISNIVKQPVSQKPSNVSHAVVEEKINKNSFNYLTSSQISPTLNKMYGSKSVSPLPQKPAISHKSPISPKGEVNILNKHGESPSRPFANVSKLKTYSPSHKFLNSQPAQKTSPVSALNETHTPFYVKKASPHGSDRVSTTNSTLVATEVDLSLNILTESKEKVIDSDNEKTSPGNISLKIGTDSETLSSADESPNSEQLKTKSRQPRKQVFTPVTRSDMEIIFPNLYSNAEEYKKESEAKALKLNSKLKERDIRFKQLSKKEPIKNISEKSKTTENYGSVKTPDKTVSSPNLNPESIVADSKDTKPSEPERALEKVSDIVEIAEINNLENININTTVPSSPLSSSAKRKRGRPKKNLSVVSDNEASGEDTPNKKPVIDESQDSPQRYDSPVKEISKGEESPRTNTISPFGKINNNIKCPMCFKTFRTENVLLKHAKHCNGVIDMEALKSPRKRKVALNESPKPDFSDEIPIKRAYESISVAVVKESPKKIVELPCTKVTKQSFEENEIIKPVIISQTHQEIVTEQPLTPQKIDEISKKIECNDSIIIIDTPVVNTIIMDDSFTSIPILHSNEKLTKDDPEKSEIIVEEPPINKYTVKPNISKSELITTDTEEGNPVEKDKSFSSKDFKDKSAGAGKRNLEKSQTVMASPLSRLSKILNTKPPVETPIVCEICNKTFRQRAYLVDHRRKHIEESSSVLNKSSTEKVKRQVESANIEVLDNSVEADAMLKCEICHKGFRKLHHLVEHREIHINNESRSRRTSVASVKSEPEAGFRCDTCDKSFRKLHHLVEHRELHMAELTETVAPQPTAVEIKPVEDATCTGCGKSFRKRHHMVEHRDIHCSPSKKGKTEDNSSNDNIRLSVASSTSEDGNNCGICGKSYRKLHHMVEHRESHAEVREEKNKIVPELLNTKDIIHECSRCYMVFPNENSLNKHVTICLRKKLLNKSKSLVENQDNTQKIESNTALSSIAVIPPTESVAESIISILDDEPEKLISENYVDNLKSPELPEIDDTTKVVKKSSDYNSMPFDRTTTAIDSTQLKRPGRRSLFPNDDTGSNSKTSLSESSKPAKGIVGLNKTFAGIQKPPRKALIARSLESAKSEETEKKTSSRTVSSSLRKSTTSIDSVISRASSRRSTNSSLSTDSKNAIPLRKSIIPKDSNASKLKIPLRKSLVSDLVNSKNLTAQKKIANSKLDGNKFLPKETRRKSSIVGSDDESSVKYMLNEESELKYKINPEFKKASRRLSQPLESRVATSSSVKPRGRTSESALSGLKLPTAKMLKTITEEEYTVRYSFPKSPKVKSKKTEPIPSTANIKKPIPLKTDQVPKTDDNAKKNKKVISSLLMTHKRKSIGGRNSIDGKKLPGITRKLQLRCCGQVFSSQANLSVHRKTHKVVKQVHKCDCGKGFDTEGLLKRHMDTEHTPPKSYKCNQCGASVRTASQFAKHKRDHETKQQLPAASGTTSKQNKARLGGKRLADSAKQGAVQNTPEATGKKGVKRKIAHGGVPLSDKMRKAMAGVKF